MPECNTCGKTTGTLRQLKRHHAREHSGSLMIPESERGPPESDQKDLTGGEPGYDDPETQYLVDDEKRDNDGRRSSLYEFERDEDPLPEFEETDEQ